MVDTLARGPIRCPKGRGPERGGWSASWSASRAPFAKELLNGHRRNCADSIFGPPHELAVEFRRATGSGLDLVRSFLRSTFRIRRGPTDRMSSKLLSVVLMNNALDVASQPRRAHFSQVKGRHASATHPPVTRGPDTETKLDEGNTAISRHFERGPLYYALETDCWLGM